MKRLRQGGTAAVLLSFAVLTGCTNQASDKHERKVILLTVSDECTYCAIYRRAFTEAMAKVPDTRLSVTINGFDPAEQATQVDQAISQNPDAIVVWPADATAIIPSLRKIKQAGIPVVVANGLLDGKYQRYWDAFVGPDDLSIGRDGGQAMVQGFKTMGKGTTGKVFVVTGQAGQPPQWLRLQGFKEALAKLAPGIKIVASQPGDWDQNKATIVAGSLFTQYGREVQGVYSEADNMMAGVLVAARRQGLDPKKLVMVGANCTIEGVTAIRQGDQYATTWQSPIMEANLAVGTVARLMDHQPVAKTTFLPHSIKTASTITDCDYALKS